jgi:hypothetical protein
MKISSPARIYSIYSSATAEYTNNQKMQTIDTFSVRAFTRDDNPFPFNGAHLGTRLPG